MLGLRRADPVLCALGKKIPLEHDRLTINVVQLTILRRVDERSNSASVDRWYS